ncbi:MAG: SDR family NAD(P)-dependent oxidoreductase [Desulfobacterales bacterium]
MITLKENITVNRPLKEVFRYVSDFRSIAEWDPGVVEAVKTTRGGTGVGTRYHLKLRYGFFRIKMKYEIKEFIPDHKVVLEGTGKTFSALDTIRFTVHGAGTRIDYQADFYFRGVVSRIAPWLTGIFQRIGRKSISGLKKALDRTFPVPEAGAVVQLLDRSVVGGLPGFTRYGFKFNQKRWNPMPASLEGKTAVVTGATSGIGQAAALRMAELGARVVIVARDMKKAEFTRNLISHATGNPDIGVYEADMGIIRQVSLLVDNLNRKESRIDILVNNAGALFNERKWTEEGLERTFATDLLGPFTLTRGLIPKLKAAAPSRIINVSSGGMYTQKIQVDDLQSADEPFDGTKAYARAKRGLVILSEIWADQLKDFNVVVHSMHPGWVRTPGIRQSLPRFYELTDSVLRTPEQGADTIVWLAAAPEASRTTGRFWLDRIPRLTHVLPNTRETNEERRVLWEELNRLSREN